MPDDELISVLYNEDYGRYSISDEALKMYSDQVGEVHSDDYLIERHDPLLIQIYNTLGRKFNGRSASIDVCYIPRKYIDFYTIYEYDGKESVHILYDAYKVHRVREYICRTDMSSDEKIREIEYIVGDGTR